MSQFLGGRPPLIFSTAGDASPVPPPPLSTPMVGILSSEAAEDDGQEQLPTQIYD